MEKAGLIIFVVIAVICVVKGRQYLWAIATYDYDILDTKKDAGADVPLQCGVSDLVSEWLDFREDCECYQGIREDYTAPQCTHRDIDYTKACELQRCPLLEGH